MIKTYRSYIFCALLFVPLFFVNIKKTHDWGDDFAQYITQAKNIVESLPQAAGGYISNPDYFLGPTVYPVGFPLLLSAMYLFTGNDIQSFQYLITACLFLMCITLFVFYKKYFSSITSLCLLLVFIYNPLIVSFKTEVISDIPFTLLLIVCVIIYRNFEKNILLFSILLGIGGGILISVRNIGLVFPIAMGLDAITRFLREWKNRSKRMTFLAPFVSLIMMASYYFFLSKVLFPLPSGIVAYGKILDWDHLQPVFLKNFSYTLQYSWLSSRILMWVTGNFCLSSQKHFFSRSCFWEC